MIIHRTPLSAARLTLTTSSHKSRLFTSVNSSARSMKHFSDTAVSTVKGDESANVELPLFLVTHWLQERQQILAEQRALWEKNIKQAATIAELQRYACHALDEKTRSEKGFSVHGGLERIGYIAVIEGVISPTIRVQSQLDALSQEPAFINIYEKEINTRGLDYSDVDRCREDIYSKVSKYAYVSGRVIEINSRIFGRNELAATISYYKMQDTWKNRLKWKEI